MEALTAIALVGNVLQFAELLAKLISKTSEIRDHGTTLTNGDIELAISDLVTMGQRAEHAEVIGASVATSITKEEHVITTCADHEFLSDH